MDDFNNITNDEEFLELIKLEMGLPVINIEMAEEQYLAAIANSVLEYNRYAAGEMITEYCILNLSAGTSFYPVSACRSVLNNGAPVNVQSVVGIEISSNLDGINNLFTPAHILLVETGAMMYPNGGAFGPIINNVGAGNPLSNYNEAIMYLKEITTIFGKSLSVRFLPSKQMLQTVPTPTTGGPCIVNLTQGLDKREMYNSPLFRKLALSRVMMIYGRICRKYNGTLPDGLTVNSSEIMTEAKELYQEALTAIKLEQPPVDFFVF